MMMHINFNYWYLIAPLLVFASFFIGGRQFQLRKNSYGEPYLHQRLSDFGLRVLCAVVSGLSAALVTDLMFTESFRGFVELCGRDAADSEFSAIFLIMILGIFYCIVEVIAFCYGYEVSRRLLIADCTEHLIDLEKPLTPAEKFRARREQFWTDASPMYETKKSVNLDELTREVERLSRERSDEKVIDASYLLHTQQVCTRLPFSNLGFLPKSWRHRLGLRYFPDYRSYIAYRERRRAELFALAEQARHLRASRPTA